jgi:probable rRNA maturation factor
LKSLAKRLLQSERRSPQLEVSLLLCDDATIQTLNQDYRGQDQATDVLSFPQEEGPPMPLGTADDSLPSTLGDVVISLETAARQATEHGWTLQEEVEALLAHGMFHLLGYDHDTPEESALMKDKERQLLGERSIWRSDSLSDDADKLREAGS